MFKVTKRIVYCGILFDLVNDTFQLSGDKAKIARQLLTNPQKWTQRVLAGCEDQSRVFVLLPRGDWHLLSLAVPYTEKMAMPGFGFVAMASGILRKYFGQWTPRRLQLQRLMVGRSTSCKVLFVGALSITWKCSR